MSDADDTLAEQLRTTTRFRTLHHLVVCDSTQDTASSASAGEGSIVVWSDEQLAGRGRNERTWHGSAGQDVEATFRIAGVRVPDPAVLAAALPAAVVECLEPICGTRLSLKWPNDVYHAGRKLAGVLIDASGNPPDTYLVGVGVNVNRTDFPAELRDTAASLALIGGRTMSRERILLAIAQALDAAVVELTRNQTGRLAEIFSDRLGLVGKRVTIEQSGDVTAGRLEHIDLQEARLEAHDEPFRLARVQRIAGRPPGE